MTGNRRAAIFCGLDPFGIGSTDTEIIAGNAKGRVDEEGKIFGTHIGLAEGNDDILAQRIADRTIQSAGESGIVDGHRRRLGHLDDRKLVVGQAMGSSNADSDAFDRGDQLVADLLIIRTDRDLQICIFRDDIVFLACMKSADGDHARLQRPFFAADDRLQANDDLRTIAGQLAREHPITNEGEVASAIPFQESLVGDVRTATATRVEGSL